MKIKCEVFIQWPYASKIQRRDRDSERARQGLPDAVYQQGLPLKLSIETLGMESQTESLKVSGLWQIPKLPQTPTLTKLEPSRRIPLCYPPSTTWVAVGSIHRERSHAATESLTSFQSIFQSSPSRDLLWLPCAPFHVGPSFAVCGEAARTRGQQTVWFGCVCERKPRNRFTVRDKKGFSSSSSADSTQHKEISFLADLFLGFQAVLLRLDSNIHWAWIKLVSFPSVYEMAKDQGATGRCSEQQRCRALCLPDTPHWVQQILSKAVLMLSA